MLARVSAISSSPRKGFVLAGTAYGLRGIYNAIKKRMGAGTLSFILAAHFAQGFGGGKGVDGGGALGRAEAVARTGAGFEAGGKWNEHDEFDEITEFGESQRIRRVQRAPP